MNKISERLDQLSPLQRAVYALKETRSKLDAIERKQTEPIAIIGLGCRFPGGANNPELFWELLHHGIDAIQDIPPSRWDVEAYYDPNPETPGKMYTRRGGFLEGGVEEFDAAFFGLSPREVVSMDPQQRLLLEVSWEALEQAGQAPAKLLGSQTGVFVGMTTNEYAQRALFDEPTHIDIYTATGNALNIAAGRLSYLLGLQGPSMAIDTACSSSLVAVHLACQSLRAAECDLAIAGGVNVMLSPQVTIAMSKLHALAADGCCKTFDAAADGYGRGEGCGIVILKRLSDAIAAGDNILALIRGSAVNQDGRSSGLTVPNGLSQQAVIQAALTSANVEPTQISYVEAHGTGTPLGDPIELRALATVLGQGRSPNHPLQVGSVKTNIGHLEAAAGIAGLIKVVLAMQQDQIPPHLHLKQLNPHIQLPQAHMMIPTEPTPWMAIHEIGSDQPLKRVAGVSSFGFNGTNAHLILEEAPIPAPTASGVDRPLHIFTLSARSETALMTLADRFQHFLQTHLLQTHPSASLADICFTANTGRSHFDHRLAIVTDSCDRLCQQLAEIVAGKSPEGLKARLLNSNRSKIAFVLTDPGCSYVGMGQQLYQTQPTFRQAFDRCDELLRSSLPQSLVSVVYPESETSSSLDATLDAALDAALDATYAPPALFALEYALAQLWQSWGIEPAAITGHGIGDYVAACVAGIISLEDGLKLVTQAPLLGKDIKYAAPQLPFISSVTGKLIKEDEMTSDYWQHSGRTGAALSSRLQSLQEQGHEVFIEISPHPIAIHLKQQSLAAEIGIWLPSLEKGQADWQQLLQSLGTLYHCGFEIDWRGFDQDYQRGRLALPTYPFERQRYWASGTKHLSSVQGKMGHSTTHPLLEQRLASPLPHVQFESQFSLSSLPLVADHRLYGTPLVNFVIYLEMALAGAKEVFGNNVFVVEDIFIAQALTFPNNASQTVQLIVESEVAGKSKFRIFSVPNSIPDQSQNYQLNPETSWTLRASGQLHLGEPEPIASIQKNDSIESIKASCQTGIPASEFYQMMRDRGADLGLSCQWLEQVWRGEGEAAGKIRFVDSPTGSDDPYHLPLGVIDACFQLLAASLPSSSENYMLVGVEKFQFYGRADRQLWGKAQLDLDNSFDRSQGLIKGDIAVMDESGQRVVTVVNAQLKRVSRETLQRFVESSPLKQTQASETYPETSSRLSREQLLTLTPEDCQVQLEAYLLEQLAKALQLPIADLQPSQMLTSLVDSLITVELKNQIETDLQVIVPAAQFFEEISIAQLATFIMNQLNLELNLLLSNFEQIDEKTLATVLVELEELSEAEAEVLLMEVLN